MFSVMHTEDLIFSFIFSILSKFVSKTHNVSVYQEKKNKKATEWDDSTHILRYAGEFPRVRHSEEGMLQKTKHETLCPSKEAVCNI